MNDTFAWLWVVLIVGMTAIALLLRYWVTIRSPRYLYAAYATTVVWIGALLVIVQMWADLGIISTLVPEVGC